MEHQESLLQTMQHHWNGGGVWMYPILLASIIAIAIIIERSIVLFGRVRIDREAFLAGRDLAIVELNGVTAEPTHIYDPDASLLVAWRTLCAHWSDAFRFGACNRRLGHRPTSMTRLARLVVAHLRAPAPALTSD